MAHWSPLKAGLVSAMSTIVIVMIIGGVVVGVTAESGGEASARGEMMGRGAVPFALFVGCIAFLIQYRRRP
jgi:hypothetical protein